MPRTEKGRTKERMVGSAMGLLTRQGAAAVTVDAVLADSGAPRGSVYHHFPGGRNELLMTAATTAAGFITHLLDEAMDVGDPEVSLERFVQFWRAALQDSGYRHGCPMVALAVDERDELPEGSALARDVFDDWLERLRVLVEAAGVPEGRASGLATLVLASIEGAIVLCRTRRSTGPLDDVVAELVPVLRRAVAESAPDTEERADSP